MRNDQAQWLQQREHCPACRQTDFTTVHSEPYTSAGITQYLERHYQGRSTRHFEHSAYTLLRCKACGLVFQAWVPTPALLAEIYDLWIPPSAKDELRATWTLDDYRYFSEQVQFFIQYFKLPPREIQVMDFGFGWAEWARMAMAYGCEVCGLELSKERIAHARSVGLKVSEIGELPAGHFHFINTEQVFEHLVHPRLLLETLTASLRVGGLIKISVPQAKASIERITRTGEIAALTPAEIMPIAPLEHINAFTYDTVVALARTVGLRPVRPSLRQLYNSASGWLELQRALRLVVRPIYRHLYPKSTFVYFERQATPSRLERAGARSD